MDSIPAWVISLIGSGGIGAALTYIFTFKSKNRIVKSEADAAQVKVEHDKLDLKQDRFDYLLETLDKYIKDYHELEQSFRNKLTELRNSMDDLAKENARVIQEKCNEIASLKSKVTYLNGIRCYDFICPKRIKDNPDKKQQ